MGTWGAASFENDIAMDWAADVSEIADIEQRLDHLSALDEDGDTIEAPVVDVDLACEVIAAAESVAVLMGRIAKDVPEELLKRLNKFDGADAKLIEKAKFAVSRVLMDSGLVELWAEGGEYPNEWNVAITGLIDRLNADVPFETPTREQVVGISGDLTPCAFCGEGIDAKELASIEFRDLSDKDALYMSRGIYCHLACLNGKLHPKHLIQNWKFAVDDAEVDRILGKDAD
ncbi:DUF4259 domain-containing protein [Parasphingorhabdus sp.]|uniref:DUF4259 domain-containing protein n=1 Tax=Parasphingorhabdus sp. TaxID=2709688 RepID=UPI003296A253